MKKVNNKGITLIELIVSFALIGVSIIYFSQTLYTVKKVYATARDETNEFIAKDYALRLLDKYIDKNGTTDLTYNFCNKIVSCGNISVSSVNGINSYQINDIIYENGKTTSVTLYKYIPASTPETSNE